ncbi:MAG: DNRLRE domain-containing protein, partial [Planctomycetes bacterium]|nr:DNRLRE domain-containing protein [Planctomycetota bacterium]
RPDGPWDPLHEVDDVGTREFVQLKMAENTLLVSFRSTDDFGPVVYWECSAATIVCVARHKIIDDLDARDVTGPKHNVSDDVVILASISGAALGVRALLGEPQNQAPSVDAGADQTVPLSAGALLDGDAWDDGLPNPPGALAAAWSAVSGPGAVTFADDGALDTTATFSAAGEYVLRLTADDGELSSFDDVGITVSSTSLPVTVAFQDGVSPAGDYAGTRDVTIQAKSPGANFGLDATLLVDGSPDLGTLVKWDLSSIPAGSVAQSVSITLDVTNRTNHDYELYELLREWDEVQATWTAPLAGQSWQIAGADGQSDRGDQVLAQAGPASKGLHTFELNAAGLAVVQSWLDAPADNHGFLLKDYVGASDGMDLSSREAADPARRPRLTITYLPPGGEPQNQPPAVDAGADQTILLSEAVLLDGTVSDDGLPQPPGALTTTWSVVSGPGTATIDQPHSVDTSATFTIDGVYVFRLTADDGALTAYDDMTVTVNEAGGGEPVTIAFQDGVAPHSGYNGTRDARLESSDPDLNGGGDSLQADGTPDTSSLLQWDVAAIPAGSQVQSASITLNVTNTSIHSYEFYRVLQPWQEQEATWVQFAAGSLWQSPGAMGAGDAETTVLGSITALNSGSVTIELNPAGVQVVQAWVNEPSSNYGLLLQDYVNATDLAAFTSREGNIPAKRPKLSVAYIPPETMLSGESKAATDAALASYGSSEPAPEQDDILLLLTILPGDFDLAQRAPIGDRFTPERSTPPLLLELRRVDALYAELASVRITEPRTQERPDPDEPLGDSVFDQLDAGS